MSKTITEIVKTTIKYPAPIKELIKTTIKYSDSIINPGQTIFETLLKDTTLQPLNIPASAVAGSSILSGLAFYAGPVIFSFLAINLLYKSACLLQQSIFPIEGKEKLIYIDHHFNSVYCNIGRKVITTQNLNEYSLKTGFIGTIIDVDTKNNCTLKFDVQQILPTDENSLSYYQKLKDTCSNFLIC